jgi:uncharacterized protein YijF (DUF1287 family)
LVFFRRHGEALPITTSADDYRAGDVVSWELSHGLTHIGRSAHPMGGPDSMCTLVA